MLIIPKIKTLTLLVVWYLIGVPVKYAEVSYVMKYSEIKQKRWFKILTNKFVFVGLVFLVWMLFLDANSWLTHRELNKEKNELLDNKAYYLKEIQNDKTTLDILRDSVEIERFARETYFMKRSNEEIFIIEFQDSLKTK